METDASGYALGVVIAQLHNDGIHPIAKFFLGAQEPIQIWTDHKNLQYFCEP